jgi:predicted amidophosphoribosyltransferase
VQWFFYNEKNDIFVIHIMISDLLKNIFSYLFPPVCIVCGNEDTNINICNICSGSLPLTREMRRPWLFSLYRYRDESVTTCIRHLKNFPDADFVDQLLRQKQIMITGWTIGMTRFHNCSEIILIPIPLHKSRFLDRGYNQAEIIAKSYQKILLQKIKIPVRIETTIIKKSKYTDKQALITDRSERLRNIHGAFEIQNAWKAKLSMHALAIIIDDVTTTGGTLDEVKKVLEPYVKTVGAFTLAH